jgi:two-component system, NtrC family, sensor kinase
MPNSLKAEAFYDVFREMIALVHSSTDVNEVLELVVWKVTQILKANGAIVRILNVEKGQLELGAACGLSENYLSKGPVTNQKMIAEFYSADRPIIIDDILNDPRIQYKQEAWDEGIRMMLNLPITLRKNLVGIIRVLFARKRNFSPEELDFLTTLARQCACAIERARLFEEQQSRYDQLVSQTEKLSALGRMAAGIAHEINNPLSGILLYSSNLRKKVQEAYLKDGLDIIIQETIRCRGIIQDLLEFSRGNEPSMTAANMNSIIEKTLGLLQNVFSLNRITVRKELSPDLPECFMDQNQIEQVFLNLLLNAVEAVQEHGVIVVRSHIDSESNCISCEVEDTGCGISPEDMPKIFEPFFSTKSKGTGLGLAVTYGIIKNHRGNIKAFSQKGNGTRIVLEMPISTKDCPSKP